MWILWCHTTAPIKKSTKRETIKGLCYILCSSNSHFSCYIHKADREIHSLPIAPGMQKSRWSFTKWDFFFFQWSGFVKQWHWMVTAGICWTSSAAWQIFQVTFPTADWQVECETHSRLEQLYYIHARTLSQPCACAIQEHQLSSTDSVLQSTVKFPGLSSPIIC